MKRIYYILLLLGALFAPSKAPAQSIEKITIGTQTYLLISTEGMPANVRYPIGYRMTDSNGRTIRHQNQESIGNNPNLNSRLPSRFIVAPYDGWIPESWTAGMGIAATQNSVMQPISPITGNPGCSSTTITADGRKWRLPTLRELELMWVFRDILRMVYTGNHPVDGDSRPGLMAKEPYWSATEKSATEAYAVDFSDTPWTNWGPRTKTTYTRYRCVSDY